MVSWGAVANEGGREITVGFLGSCPLGHGGSFWLARRATISLGWGRD